jgi:hypothetical protein
MLNISKQIYAGWNTSTTKHELPEAEIIPYGTSAHEKKRLEKLTNSYTVLKEHDNIPLPGFTLYTTGRKNYGSADPTWLVIDPRGFLTRISGENLEMILKVTGITEGLIQERCVWARENTQTKMSLVPISSKEYIDAANNTELLESRVSIKDVEIGDKVLLQNKLIGEYMGVASLYGPAVYNYIECRPQSFIRRQVVKIANGKYFYQSDAKILKILKKSSVKTTREQSIKLMNEDIRKGTAYFTNTEEITAPAYFSTRGMIKLVSIQAVSTVELSFEEITLNEAESLFHIASLSSDSYMLLLEDVHGKFHTIDFPYSFSSQRADKNSMLISDVDKIDCAKGIIVEERRSHYASQTKARYSLDNFAKFYKIVKHVKNDSYV